MPRLAKKGLGGNSHVIPSVASPIHRSRYHRHYLEKKTVEEIAAEDGVDVKQVRKSLSLIDMYYQMTTETELRSAQIAIIMKLGKQTEQALEKALKAKRATFTPEGELLGMEDDHNIQLQAVTVMNDMIEAVSSKGKGFTTNTQINVGVGVQQGGASAHGGTFEDRLREIQKKRAEAPALPPANIVDEDTGEGDVSVLPKDRSESGDDDPDYEEEYLDADDGN